MFNVYLPRDNNGCILSGWGSMATGASQSSDLQETNLNVFPQKFCNNSYNLRPSHPYKSEIDLVLPKLFQPDLLCAGSSSGGSGSCLGDSGGPLVIHDKLASPPRHVQIGVVQGGAGECGNKLYPGVYIRLDNYDVLDFIYRTAFGRSIDSSSTSKNYIISTST